MVREQLGALMAAALIGVAKYIDLISGVAAGIAVIISCVGAFYIMIHNRKKCDLIDIERQIKIAELAEKRFNLEELEAKSQKRRADDV